MPKYFRDLKKMLGGGVMPKYFIDLKNVGGGVCQQILWTSKDVGGGGGLCPNTL